MSGPTPDLDELLSQTQRLVSGFRRDSSVAQAGLSENAVPMSGEEPSDPVVYEGSDADRLVRAIVGRGGRVESIELNERAVRLGSAELGERVTAAVNAALDALRADTGTGGAVGGLDPEEVAGLQDSSMAQLSQLTTSLTDLMRGFGR